MDLFYSFPLIMLWIIVLNCLATIPTLLWMESNIHVTFAPKLLSCIIFIYQVNSSICACVKWFPRSIIGGIFQKILFPPQAMFLWYRQSCEGWVQQLLVTITHVTMGLSWVCSTAAGPAQTITLIFHSTRGCRGQAVILSLHSQLTFPNLDSVTMTLYLDT